MGKKNKFIIVILIITILVVGYVISKNCNSGRVEENIELKNNIVKIAKSSDKIDFSQLTNFNWDTMYLFTPYTDTKKILKKDGVINYSDKLNMEYRDTINIVAFVDSKKIVTYIELNRSEIDFKTINENKISKEESIFRLDKDGNKYSLSLVR